MLARRLEILLVEDSPTDQLLATEALKESKVPCRVQVVADGEEALAFLRRTGTYNFAVRPDLILLDLNIPRKDGRYVLSELKSDSSLKTIPVVVLTTSTSEVDVAASYGLHANCFVSKPLAYERFREVVQSIVQFWSEVATLPSGRI